MNPCPFTFISLCEFCLCYGICFICESFAKVFGKTIIAQDTLDFILRVNLNGLLSESILITHFTYIAYIYFAYVSKSKLINEKAHSNKGHE